MKYSHGPNIRIKGDRTNLTVTSRGTAQVALRYGPGRADSRFVPSQWETVLLCDNVSHWLGASLESTLPGWGLLSQFLSFHYFHGSWAAVTPVKYDCDSNNLSYFCKIENLPIGEINKHSLSNPHSRLWWWHAIEMFAALFGCLRYEHNEGNPGYFSSHTAPEITMELDLHKDGLKFIKTAYTLLCHSCVLHVICIILGVTYIFIC